MAGQINSLSEVWWGRMRAAFGRASFASGDYAKAGLRGLAIGIWRAGVSAGAGRRRPRVCFGLWPGGYPKL